MVKIIKFFFTYGWTIWASLVALAALLFWFAFGDIDAFFSSDAMYLPALYRDFFQDGYTLNGWQLNQAPNFFPDMLLFFILNGLSGNFVTAIFSYSVIQYFSIIFILYLIYKQLKPNLHPSTFTPAIFLFSSFLFLYFLDQNWWFSSLLNHNAFHNSAFIMALLCIWLFCKYLNTKSSKCLTLISIISILCGASDKLFFICFTIPVALVVIVLYFFNKDWKIMVRLLIVLAICTIVAVVLWIFFKNNPYFSLTRPYGNITSEYIKDSWLTFSKQLYGYLTRLSFVLVLTYFMILSYIVAVIHFFTKAYILIKEKKSADTFFAFELWVLVFSPAVFFAPILAGSYDNVVSIRYSYFPYLLLPFNLVLLSSNWLNNKRLFKVVLNSSLSLLILGYLWIHYPIQELGKGLKHYFNFYPERARIIDGCFSDSDDRTQKYGIIDDYWAARQVTMFSKKGIRLYCTFAGGDPWLHAANKHWFTDNDKGKHAHCEFTFLLWSKENELPEFFRTTNIDPNPVDMGDWYLYHVAPYRYIIPGIRFKLDPVLIDSTASQNHDYDN